MSPCRFHQANSPITIQGVNFPNLIEDAAVRIRLAILAVALVGFTWLCPAQAEDKAAFPSFRMQEIETGLTVGYAVTLVDINGDGKKDIVVVDSARVVWYENPTWKMRTIIQGQTKPDNVCVAAHDIDGDGQIDLVIGAEWKPFNTKSGGTLQWLKRGKTFDDPWTLYPIGEEPTVHRIRWADLDGSGKPKLLLGPLMGRDSTKDKNWMDGSPVRMLAYSIPKDPTRDRWDVEVLDEKNLHVVHNFWPIPSLSVPSPQGGRGQGEGAKRMDVLTASYEGVGLLKHDAGKWAFHHIGAGNQENPKGNRGASEIKMGQLKNGRKYIATVEPWHGHQIVVYTEPENGQKMWDRHVIDDELRWGHAVWCADLDGDGDEELIIGVRDDPGPKDTGKHRRGVRIYKAIDGKGAKWQRHIIDDGGVAVEDLAAADLDGDGRIDIVAVGRQTKNARIYWNLGGKK